MDSSTGYGGPAHHMGAVQKWGSIIEVPTQQELALFDPPLFPSV
jgi:hypothetical protein